MIERTKKAIKKVGRTILCKMDMHDETTVVDAIVYGTYIYFATCSCGHIRKSVQSTSRMHTTYSAVWVDGVRSPNSRPLLRMSHAYQEQERGTYD